MIRMIDDSLQASALVDWMAAVIGGDVPAWPVERAASSARILAVADREGVIALLHERLREPAFAGIVPADFRDQLAVAARVKTVQSLVRERRCRVVLTALRAAQLPTLLLKGSALAYWAYPSAAMRECSDIDLLLRSREDTDRAMGLLAMLGYTPREEALPGDLVTFEHCCMPPPGNLAEPEIDLHWRLSGTPAFAFRFDWDELHSRAIALPALASDALGLAPVHAFIHACMHRMQNKSDGPADTLKWLFDLIVLARGFRDEDWNALLDLAVARGLAGTCMDGIEAASGRFGEIAPTSILSALAAAARDEIMDVQRMHEWRYVQRMSFLAFPTLRMRLRWLRQRLLPNPRYLRERHGSRGGFAGAIVARVRAVAERLRS